MNKTQTTKKTNSEKGIAIILALIMLLVMSIMAISASFLSNIDFQGMAIFKRGQEAFLASESCIVEGRRRLENLGYAQLLNELATLDSYRGQGEGGLSATNNPFANTVLIDLDINQARCRSGNRILDQTPSPFFNRIGERNISRDLKHYSRSDQDTTTASVTQISFVSTGKDREDEDIDDTNLQINTGSEIAFGIEVVPPGGDGNVH